jgi:hypothetical protein
MTTSLDRTVQPVRIRWSPADRSGGCGIIGVETGPLQRASAAVRLGQSIPSRPIGPDRRYAADILYADQQFDAFGEPPVLPTMRGIAPGLTYPVHATPHDLPAMLLVAAVQQQNRRRYRRRLQGAGKPLAAKALRDFRYRCVAFTIAKDCHRVRKIQITI